MRSSITRSASGRSTGGKFGISIRVAQKGVLLFRGDLQNFFFPQGRQPCPRSGVTIEKGGAILPDNDVRRSALLAARSIVFRSPR